MKKSSESCVEQIYQIRPEHLNVAGCLFGGRLMEWNVQHMRNILQMRIFPSM